MPIIVVTPEPGAPFGQGFPITLSTDFVGPLTNPRWWFEWQNDDGTDLWTVGLFQPFSVHIPSTQYYRLTSYPLDGWPIWSQPGETARLHIELQDDTGTVEETNIAFEVSTLGHETVLSRQIQAQPNNTAAITTMNANISTILSDITKTFAPGVAGKIADLLLKPSPAFIVRELIGDFTGQFSVDRPSGPIGVDAFGINWEVLSYGGGIGIDPTTPQRFGLNILDLDIRYTDNDGHVFTGDAPVFDFSNGYYFWPTSFPTVIEGTIVPSVELRLWWLLAGI